jgi:hypothetical protein
LSPDAAEELYARLEREAGDKPKRPTARLSSIKWSEDGGQSICTALVGADIDCGPIHEK